MTVKGPPKTPVCERVSKAFEYTLGNIKWMELSQSLKSGLNGSCWEWHAVKKKKRRKKEAEKNREGEGEWANPPEHPYIAPYSSPTACKRPGM